MEDNKEEEVVIKKKKAGRRSLKEVNEIRTAAGLMPYSDNKEKIIEKKVIVERKVPGKRRGRPPKLSIVGNSEKARQQQLLAGLLHSKGVRIIEQIISKALDPDDKDQITCMKMCVDRILPTSYFEKAKESGSRGVTIQIMGVNQQPINITSNDYIDSDVTPDIDDVIDAEELDNG